MRCFIMVLDKCIGGGVEKVMLRLALEFIERGYVVKFILINPILSIEIPNEIDVIFLNQKNIKEAFKFSRYKRTANKLQKILDDINSKHLIQAVISNLSEADRTTRYLSHYPVFHCIHNNFFQSEIRHKKGIKRWLRKKKLQQRYKDKHLIFVTQGLKEELLQKVGIKPLSAKVIYNPFPIQKIQALSNAYTVDYQNYFLYMGRFSQEKGYDKLLKIYAAAQLENPLLLMGEGNLEKIKHLIKYYQLEKKVFLIPFQKNPFPYVKQAIALLLTSSYESFGNVLVEALICETPAVSYDCPSGPREILNNKLSEFLIPFDNQELFIKKIKELAQKPRRITEEDANLTRFEAKNIASQYIKTIEDLSDI